MKNNKDEIKALVFLLTFLVGFIILTILTIHNSSCATAFAIFYISIILSLAIGNSN